MKVKNQISDSGIYRSPRWLTMLPMLTAAAIPGLTERIFHHLTPWGVWLTVLIGCPFFVMEMVLSWRQANRQKQAMERKFAAEDAALLEQYERQSLSST